jgi:hypothetical protein
LSGHGLVRLNRRTVFDLLPSQIHEQDFSALMEAAESMGSEEHHAPQYPGTSVHDNIPNSPVLIVKIKVLHVAYFAIQRVEYFIVKLFNTLEHKSYLS